MLPGPDYKTLKKMYYEFKKNPPSSPFDRWITEFKYTSNLVEFAKKANLEEDVLEFKVARQEAIDELGKMGLKYKPHG